MDLKIDPKDVTEAAAQKVADAILENYGDLAEAAESRIEQLINSVITEEMRASMTDTIEAKLSAEMEKVLQQKIVPVDIWGEAKGEPSTIREQLHKRALEYWEERVEPDRHNTGRYRRTTYGGKPRHVVVFQDVARDAFEGAMKDNINEMVKAFQAAMAKDMNGKIAEYIKAIINNRVLETKRAQ